MTVVRGREVIYLDSQRLEAHEAVILDDVTDGLVQVAEASQPGILVKKVGELG